MGRKYLNFCLLIIYVFFLLMFSYRLGALGFLANPALMAASVPTTGFYGIQDQRLALEWIRYNIKGFGGY